MSTSSINPERWKQIEDLYQAACDLDASDRARLLAAADSDLRRTVESLLAQPTGGGPLRGVAADLVHDQTSADSDRAETRPLALLPSGTTLGRYTIVAAIGTGGMGAVYRARDGRLDREVAIKVLAPHLTDDEAARKRLAKEARTVASLSHPNIVALFDVGEHGDTLYLVTELLSGCTVRDLIRGGQLPERTIVDLGIQTARGLAAAHDRHIVHRDLKPENLFMTRDGVVKILDFGLAKPLESIDAHETAMTSVGAVLGTVGYMAPEQITGGAVDARTDLFALGVVLHEAVTGQPAFPRETRSAAIRAVLSGDPPALDPSRVSSALAGTIMRCLAKAPAERFQSARDLAFTLQLTARSASISGVTRPHVTPPGRVRWRSATGAAVVAAVLAGVGYAVGRVTTSTTPPNLHQFTFRQGHIGHARFAPNGQMIVYSATWDGEPFRLFSTLVGSHESRPIDLPAADLLAMSATGNLAISTARPGADGFEPHGNLAVVALAGGAPRELYEQISAADWAPDEKTMAIVRQVGDRQRLEFPVGTVVHESDIILRPRISPDGTRVCFFEMWGRLMVAERAGPARLLTDELGRGGDCVWVSNGRELWVNSSESSRIGGGATHMSIEAIDMTGRRRIVSRFSSYVRLEDISPDGKVLVSSGSLRYAVHGLLGTDERERDLSVFDTTRVGHFPADGRQILLWDNSEGAIGGAIFLRGLSDSAAIRLGGVLGSPLALAPGGQWAATATAKGQLGRYVFNQFSLIPTGAGTARTIDLPIEIGRRVLDPSGRANWKDRTYELSSDGQRLLIPHGWAKGRPPRVYVHDLRQGWTKPITPEGVTGPAVLSADGRLVATNEAATLVVYSVDSGERRELPGGRESALPARWSADARSLLLIERLGSMARVVRRTIENGSREVIREIRLPDPAGVVQFDPWISDDGQKYVYTSARRLSNLFLVEGLK